MVGVTGERECVRARVCVVEEERWTNGSRCVCVLKEWMWTVEVWGRGKMCGRTESNVSYCGV